MGRYRQVIDLERVESGGDEEGEWKFGPTAAACLQGR